MASSSSDGGGIGFFGALAILFIGLKLGDVIHWSWWWVLSPLWVPMAVFLVVLMAIAAWSLATVYLVRRKHPHLRRAR